MLIEKRGYYKNVTVIGYGKIAGEVLKTVFDAKDGYGYEVVYLEHEVHPFRGALDYARENEITYYTIEDKEELGDYFRSIGTQTLIISASNNFLFPKDVVNKSNLTIINFHNALLPKYPGRNAPSWVIFQSEKDTGITWHFVTEEVDAGNIIIQKCCEIGADEKAYELAGRLMDMAMDAFTECFSSIIENKMTGFPQKETENRKVYKSYEMPGDGKFSLDDKGSHIYRLLRSIDYGKSGIFPLATTIYQHKEIKILRYKKIKIREKTEASGFLYRPLEEGYLLKLKYKEM